MLDSLAQFSITPPRIDAVHCDFLDSHGVRLNVLRLDEIHPKLHGNKWFKLKKNLATLKDQGVSRVLSFGGAYSNHLAALAAAGQQFGFETIGFVRGELITPLNPVLKFAQAHGMELVSLSRGDYRRKANEMFVQELITPYMPCSVLPEGGSNLLAVQGCNEIAEYCAWQEGATSNVLALACGTGATAAGMIAGLQGREWVGRPEVMGFSVLKAPGYLEREIRGWLDQLGISDCKAAEELQWQVIDEFHGGGYGKCPPALLQFIEEFQGFSSIPIEPVYTGKLFYGLFQMIASKRIATGADVLVIHTGGVAFS